MAMWDEEIQNEETPTEENVKVTYDDYEDVATNITADVDQEMLTRLEGNPWTIEIYFSQIIDDNSELGPYDPDRSPVYQQYWGIRELELMVPDGSELSSTIDEENKTQLTGSAIVYPGIMPNVGDCFIARVLDGRVGLFNVSGSEKANYLKTAPYRITYNIISYLTADTRNDLERKTVKLSYFDKKFLTMGRAPIISERDRGLSEKLETAMRQLADAWIRKFQETGQETLSIPNQIEPTYDPYLVSAIKNCFDHRFHPGFSKLSELSINGSDGRDAVTVWDLIINPSAVHLSQLVTKMKIVGRSQFPFSRDYGSAATSRFGSFVYPTGEFVKDAEPTLKEWMELSDPVSMKTLEMAVEDDLELFPNPFSDGCYLFTESFYAGGPVQSKLEAEVLKRVNGELLNPEVLLRLADDWYGLNGVRGFYFGPVILALMLYKWRSF